MHYVKRELLVINATADNAITKLYPDIYIFLKVVIRIMGVLMINT